MPTFAELEMAFPLFEAPIEDACTDEAGACNHCSASVELRFDGACYDCFRAGKVDHTVDTEYGMVTRELATKGKTHGIPASGPEDFPGLVVQAHPVDPSAPEETWFSVEFEPEALTELVRTPTYHSWQGERWLFCCKRPMVFIGAVSRAMLTQHAEDHVHSVEESAVEIIDGTPADSAKFLDHIEEGRISTYGFRCQSCDRLRAHWDMD